MNIYFFHSPAVRQRAIAVELSLLAIYMLYLFNPTRFSSLSEFGLGLMWFLYLLIWVILGACVLIWRSGSHLPPKELPDSARWRGPNHIPIADRMTYVVGSCLLIAYAGYGLYNDDIYIPGKRGDGLHLSGLAAWLMAFSLACPAANLLSVVVDHYDRNNNEIQYAHFAAICEWIGWSLFVLAIVVRIIFQ